MKSIVILGGGLAGLSSAWHLQQAGHDNYQLFEKESRVGGLVRSEIIDGFTFDFTGHLLHFRDEYVKDLVLRLLGENLHYVERNAWIFSKNVYTRYPFQTNTFGLPADIVKECVIGFVEAKYGEQGKTRSDAPPTNGHPGEMSFEDWIYESFGAGIARHFMIPYNEKLWTVHPRELTCNWMGRFVPQASFEDILDGALADQGKRVGYNAHFYYPLHGGIESLPRALATSLTNIHLESEASEIDLRERRISFTNGEHIYYDKLISTMPLPRLLEIIRPLPTGIERLGRNLRYNSVFNINLGVDRRLTDKHWVYFPEPEYIFYRVGFPSNFSPFNAPSGTTSMYVEISYSGDKPVDKGKALQRAKEGLIEAGILRESDRILVEKCFDIRCAYVIYDRHHEHTVAKIQRALEDNGIYSVGRYGSWEYSGMQDAILQGQKVVQDLLYENGNGYRCEDSQKHPVISIVIPIFNEEKILETAVSQLLEGVNKLGVEYELLLCDNGSTDQTPQIANALSTAYQQVRVARHPQPNYGKALQLGVLNSTGELVVCFEIDFWDVAFIEMAQVLLRKYDAVVGSKRAPGARDRRPLIRRMITFTYNTFLNVVFGFGGTDTHGMKAFRRDKALDIVQACRTEKDIFATEMILRFERAGLYTCELPLEIEEKRRPSIGLLKRVPGTIANLVKLWTVMRAVKPYIARAVQAEKAMSGRSNGASESVMGRAGLTGK
jgi:UDP-galactopyranose mutase